jgi:hypothetical protein
MHKLVEGELIQISDKKGAPLTAPRLLDGAGNVRQAGLDPVIITPWFKTYRELPFAALGLPNSFYEQT